MRIPSSQGNPETLVAGGFFHGFRRAKPGLSSILRNIGIPASIIRSQRAQYRSALGTSLGNETRREASQKGPDPGDGTEQDGPSGEKNAPESYSPLIFSYAVLSIFTAIFPSKAAELLLGGNQDGYSATVLLLMRLVSTGFVTASGISFALKRALEDEPVSQQKFERLNLGLSSFATLNLLLLVTSLVEPEGSVQYPARPGFWAAAVVYVCTLLVSWGKYGKKQDLRETVKRSVPSLGVLKRDVKNIAEKPAEDYFYNSYTIITLSLAAWGLAQMFVPWKMLDLLLQNEGGDEVELMARLFGCSLVTLLPAASWSLKESTGEKLIEQTASKGLNAGIAASAGVNTVAVLPLLTSGQGGPLIIPYLVLWLATFATTAKNAVAAKS